MADPESYTFIAAGVMIILTASIALRIGTPRRVKAPHPPPSPAVPTPERSDGRPRILTGAPPSAPEQRKPAALRALKLIGGITALAVLGSAGLIVAVRALIELFRRIGD